MVVEGKQVKAAASVPLQPGLVRDGVIIDAVTVSQKISELMTSLNVKEKSVVAGVSGIHSVYRVVSLPSLPKSLLGEAARREMERVMPVPLVELYTSWQAVALSDTETNICLIGLPRDTVDAMLETLKGAGLEPKVLDIAPLALARVIDEKDALAINAGEASFDIVIVADGIPELVRSLRYSADAATVSEKIAEVREELDRTIAFYNSSHKANPITQQIATFVSGELAELLAGLLGYPVKPLPNFLSHSDNFNASEYAINIGLALKQIKAGTSRVNMNVLPEAYLPKPLPIIKIISWAFIVVAIAILVPLGIATIQAMQKTSFLQAQVKAAELQVQARHGTLPVIQKLQAEIKEARTTLDTFQRPLENARAQRAKANADLAQVTSLLPGTIKLQSISYSQAATGLNLTLTGTASDKTIVVDYARALRGSGRFSEVLITDMKEVEYNRWNFTLTLK